MMSSTFDKGVKNVPRCNDSILAASHLFSGDSVDGSRCSRPAAGRRSHESACFRRDRRAAASTSSTTTKSLARRPWSPPRDRIVRVGTIGKANIAENKPMRPDTIFWIASMTKPITATAVLMLQDEGKLSIDDPVEKHLPEFKDLKSADGKPAQADDPPPAHPHFGHG